MALVAAFLGAAAALAGEALAANDLTARVRVEIIARPASAADAARDFLVQNGGVLRSGDGVQLRLESEADAYVYVIAYGSSNTAVLLHPFTGKPEDARMRPGQAETVPEPGVFLPLDDREGRETLFTIVSATPLTDITEVLARMEAGDGDPNAAAEAVRAAYPQTRRLSFKHIGARPLVGIAATTPRASPSEGSSEAPSGASGGEGATVGIDDASASPSAPVGWSVSSSQGFGTADPAAVTGTDAATESAPAGAASGAAGAAAVTATRDGRPEPATGEREQPDTSDQVSPALRKARAAAGIDEQQFRGILATLPATDQVEIPESFRRTSREQGVLSAEGSRIRVLDRVQLESDAGWPTDDGDPGTNIQN